MAASGARLAGTVRLALHRIATRRKHGVPEGMKMMSEAAGRPHQMHKGVEAIKDAMEALEDGDHKDAALAMRRALGQLDSVAVEDFVRSVYGRGAKQAIALIADELWSRGSHANTRLCALIMRRLVHWGDLDAMLHMFRRMLKNHVPADEFSSMVLLLASARAGRVKDVLEILRQLRKSRRQVTDDRVVAVVMSAFRTTKIHREVYEVFQGLAPIAPGADKKVMRARVLNEVARSLAEAPERSIRDRLDGHFDALGLEVTRVESAAAAGEMLEGDDLHGYVSYFLPRVGEEAVTHYLASNQGREAVGVARAVLNSLARDDHMGGDGLLRAVVDVFTTHKASPQEFGELWTVVERRSMQLRVGPIEPILEAMRSLGLHRELDGLGKEVLTAKSRITPSAAIVLLDNRGELEGNWAMYRMFNDLDECGVAFELEHYMHLVNRFIASGDQALAKNLAQRIEQPNDASGAQVYPVKMSVAMLCQDFERVLALADEMEADRQEFSDQTRFILLYSLVRARAPAKALATMRSLGLLNQGNVEQLMRHYLLAGKQPQVEHLFRMLRSMGLEESKEAHVHRIGALASEDSVEDLTDALEYMTKSNQRDANVINVAMHKLIEMGNLPRAVELYSTLVDMDVQVRPLVYRDLAALAIRDHRLDMSERFLYLLEVARNRDPEAVPEEELYLTRLRAYEKFSKHKKCVREFARWGMSRCALRSDAYRYPMLSLAREGNVIGLRLLMAHMRHHGVKADMEFYADYLRAHETAMITVDTDELLTELRAHGLAPNASLFEQLMLLKMRIRAYNEVAGIFDSMLASGVKPELQHYAVLVGSLLKRHTLLPQVFRQRMRKTLMIFLEAPAESKVDAYRAVTEICRELNETQSLRELTNRLINELHVTSDEAEQIESIFEDKLTRQTAEVFGASSSGRRRTLRRWNRPWK